MKLESAGFEHNLMFDGYTTKVHQWHKGVLMITRVDTIENGKMTVGTYYTHLAILNNEHPIYPVTQQIGELTWKNLSELDVIVNKKDN